MTYNELFLTSQYVCIINEQSGLKRKQTQIELCVSRETNLNKANNVSRET